MRHRPQKAAELHATIPESAISSCGGFMGDPQQMQQQHSLANVHQWATAAAMNRKSLDDVDLALSKQQLAHQGYYVGRGHAGQLQMMTGGMSGGAAEEGVAYYYGRPGGAAAAAMMSSTGSGGGTLPRNFGGLIKEDKVRPVAKVQAQVVMRQVPSPPLKDAPAYVMAQQQQQQQVAAQPVYVNFGHLSNHVHHHHFYGGDVNTNTIALTALQQTSNNNPSSNNSAIVVNTQAEVHHHHKSLDTSAVVAMHQQAGILTHHKSDIKVSGAKE